MRWNLPAFQVNTIRMNPRSFYSTYTRPGEICADDPEGRGGIYRPDHSSGLRYWVRAFRRKNGRGVLYFPIGWKLRLVFSWWTEDFIRTNEQQRLHGSQR